MDASEIDACDEVLSAMWHETEENDDAPIVLVTVVELPRDRPGNDTGRLAGGTS